METSRTTRIFLAIALILLCLAPGAAAQTILQRVAQTCDARIPGCAETLAPVIPPAPEPLPADTSAEEAASGEPAAAAAAAPGSPPTYLILGALAGFVSALLLAVLVVATRPSLRAPRGGLPRATAEAMQRDLDDAVRAARDAKGAA